MRVNKTAGAILYTCWHSWKFNNPTARQTPEKGGWERERGSRHNNDPLNPSTEEKIRLTVVYPEWRNVFVILRILPGSLSSFDRNEPLLLEYFQQLRIHCNSVSDVGTNYKYFTERKLYKYEDIWYEKVPRQCHHYCLEGRWKRSGWDFWLGEEGRITVWVTRWVNPRKSKKLSSSSKIMELRRFSPNIPNLRAFIM